MGLDIIAGLVVAAIVTGLAVSRKRVVKLYRIYYLAPKYCNLFLYGRSRSGKTTVVKSLLVGNVPPHEESTAEFKYYRKPVELDLDKTVQVGILDYRGQKPSQVLLNPEIAQYIGKIGQPIVTGLVVIVDLVPELLDPQGNLFSDEDLVEWLQTDAETKIAKRIKTNLDYTTSPLIQLLFERTYSQHLRHVRLLINKIDLLKSAEAKGYLVVPDLEEYVLNHFREVEGTLRKACEDNQIADFSTHIISAKQVNDVRNALDGVLLSWYQSKKKL